MMQYRVGLEEAREVAKRVWAMAREQELHDGHVKKWLLDWKVVR